MSSMFSCCCGFAMASTVLALLGAALLGRVVCRGRAVFTPRGSPSLALSWSPSILDNTSLYTRLTWLSTALCQNFTCKREY